MIPDFLKKENRKKADESDQRFSDAIRRYHEHFKNDGLMTEASSMSHEEWIKVIDECIKKNLTFDELSGEEYDPDCDY